MISPSWLALLLSFDLTSLLFFWLLWRALKEDVFR